MPECGLDTRQVEPTDIPALIRDSAAAWRALLNGAQPMRERPSPDVWSGEQDPGTVAGELEDATHVIAGHLDGVIADQWARTGRRSDGARFTVESLARYLLHDAVHHLYDVTRER